MLALGIIVSLGGLIGVQVAGLAADLPRYQATIKEKVGSLRAGTIGRLPAMLKEFNKAVEEAPKEPDAASANAPAAQPAPPEPGPLPVEVHEREATPLQLAQSIAVPLLKPLTTTGIVFVVLIFILLQREDLRDRMIRLFGSSDLHRTTGAMDDAARRLSRYFLIQLGLNAAFGVLIGLGLWAIGLPSPALWGVFAACHAVRALYRLVRGGGLSHRARLRGRSRLVDGRHDGGPVPDLRTRDGPRGRAARLRQEHRTFAFRGRDLGDLLDLDVGTRRACSSPRR